MEWLILFKEQILVKIKIKRTKPLWNFLSNRLHCYSAVWWVVWTMSIHSLGKAFWKSGVLKGNHIFVFWKIFFDDFKITWFILFWELRTSINISFMKDKYFLSGGRLCGYCIIQEFSKAHSINYWISINPCWDFMLVLWLCSNTQVDIIQRLPSVGAETAACGWGGRNSQLLLNSRGWCHGCSGLVQLTNVPGQRGRDVCRAVNTERRAEENLDWKWRFCLTGLVSSVGVFLLIKLPYGPQFWQLIFACLETGSSIWLPSAFWYWLPTAYWNSHYTYIQKPCHVIAISITTDFCNHICRVSLSRNKLICYKYRKQKYIYPAFLNILS